MLCLNGKDGKIKRPRVFISYSSADKNFIDKLVVDFRKCDIEPLRDIEIIRDGKPWLETIFKDGIPTCDSFLVYLTENSIDSKIVQKEIDSGSLHQLENEGISFLPYLANSNLRVLLRSDIRTLHCREWNEDNYLEILPTVVSEIWQSYAERALHLAVLKEKNEKLKIEREFIEHKNRTKKTPFTTSQIKDFQFIYDKMNREISFDVNYYDKNDYDWMRLPNESYRFNTSLVLLFIRYLKHRSLYFDENNFNEFAHNIIKDTIELEKENYRYEISKLYPSFQNEILKYGLIKKTKTMNKDFTRKTFTFLYWIEYSKLDQRNIEITHVKTKQKNQADWNSDCRI